MRYYILCVFIFVVANSLSHLTPGFQPQVAAQEIGFLEDFALAKEREKVLKQLVPGTQDYYYFHALHYQNNQQLDKVDALLQPWVKRFGETEVYKQIRNRQSLLKYSDDPRATLDYLTQQLNLNFLHQREIPQTQRELPSRLDLELISTDRLIQQALASHANTSGFSELGLRLLANRKLSKVQRRHLLERLTHPDFPNLVDLIVADLFERDSRGFGAMKIHQTLTLQQLDELATKFPKARTQEKFVNVYLTKLHPSEDNNWEANAVEHREYLQRLWSFVSTLNPNFNSLKACILFRRLELNLEQEQFDRELFLEYLTLPRNVGYINPAIIKNVPARSHIVNLSANYANQIRLMPINNDEPLIRAYLHHFLLPAEDINDFAPYIRDTYLNRQFAIVKIINGIGDTERWASRLSPEEYKSVLNRVDIEFVSTNPEFYQPDDEVELELYVKNVKNLIVKVFEINTTNYYRKYKREIDTDINLDGLVPNFEETFSYDDDPALRQKRRFKFPQIRNRGVFIVDFIAGGKSSRALIRKGRLQISNQVTAAGQLFSVINQAGAVVTDANLWIAGARYDAENNGKILVPFSTKPGRVNAIITQGEFSCLQTFQHVAENYRFTAAFVVDRENLTRNNTARVLIRPSLQIVGGNPVPVALLKDPRFVVTSVNLDGITSTKVIDELELTEKGETVCEFVVPPRLKEISLSLSAEVKNNSRNELEPVAASQSYSINAIDDSDVIQDVHLISSEEGYFLELLGKSGEVRPQQAVRLAVRVAHFNADVDVDLQTDANGLIELGPLANVQTIQATPVGGKKQTWRLNTQDQDYCQTVHTTTGRPIELPAPAGVIESSRESLSLLEVRNGTFVTDRFQAISISDGLVKISGLDPGDYLLRMTYLAQSNPRFFHDVKIRVTRGQQANNVLVGKSRHLETRGSRALHVAKITTNQEKIRIQLDNADEFTRVHVFANRYQPVFSAYREFAQIRDLEPWVRRPSLRRSVYMEGRKIGDEYQYILRRKYASKYPGNMLERPSLLLNPWEVETTSNQAQDAADGNDFDRVGNALDRVVERGGSKSENAAGNSDFSNVDFLGDNAVLISNLQPQKNGVITIDRAAIGNRQHVRVIALNAFETVQRNLELPLRKLQPEDARLARSLDPEKHFSQSKQAEILNTGDTLLIEDTISARFQQYDDLGDVYQLYSTLNPDSYLPRFKFILTWSETPIQEKRELYSKFACHELNFFLMKKDPEFFEKIVVPHLANKRDKTFMDHWLLKENLDEFANPWKYARLNSVEKILLSQRLEERSGDMIRHLNEAYLLAPTSRVAYDRLYDTTIRGLGLESSWAKDAGIDNRPGDTQLPRLAAAAKPRAKLKGEGAQDQAGAVPTPGGGGVGGGGGGGGYGYGYGGGGGLGGRGRASGETADKFVEAGESSIETESVNGALGMDLANGRVQWRELSAGVEFDLGKQPENTRLERRSATQPVKKLAMEERSRTRPDGSVEKYLVEVPGTKQLTRDYDAEVAMDDGVQALWEYQRSALERATHRLYRRLGPTKQWMENNYYRLRPDEQQRDLVKVNRFWRDYANHTGDNFLSPYFPEATRTFTEMMFAISVLDLPLKSPEQKFEYVGNSMTMTAQGPTIALHQQVRPAIFDRGNTTILVSENFFQKNDRYRFEDGVRFDKFVSGDFLAHTLYGSQVVITNPTSTPRAVDLLIQIPRGSVACSGAQETRTIQLDLEAFSTKTFEYAFYFPTAGAFDHYPAHVSADERVLAVADGVTFKVIDRPAEVDKTSWAFISQNGSDDQVIEFLNRENVLRLGLDQIAFRMKNETFFQRAIETLRNRYVYNHLLWSYAIKHNDVNAIREYLRHAEPFVSNCGRHFQSELLTIDAVERNWYQHKEYWPLINDRAHQLGPQRKILNPSFFAQYQDLLSVLANRRQLTDDDHLVITYYLLLQDRIDTALGHFANVARARLPFQIQYDYCDAYLDLYRENPKQAAVTAAKWADYPVDLWRNRFQSILAQVDEINGGKTETVDDENNTQQQTELASQAESFDFEVASGTAKINSQNLSKVDVNYYEMDIELLFSRSPFAQDELDGFSMIRPNFAQSLALATDGMGKSRQEFDLPESMKNKNILVEIVAGDQTKSQPYFAHSLNLQLLEKYGQIYVTEEDSGKPIPKVYVKVYARMMDGMVRFHKDGYTDLRGRFDYVSQSNRSIDGIQKFSILVLSDQHGAVIRQSDPPKE